MEVHHLHSVILSAENLCNPVGFEAFFDGCQELFDTKIVFYIRREDDFLLSVGSSGG